MKKICETAQLIGEEKTEQVINKNSNIGLGDNVSDDTLYDSFIKEYFEKYVTKICTYCVYTRDWGDDELNFYHNRENNDYYLATANGFSLSDCPSNIAEIDPDLVDEAMACFYRHNSTYGVIGFSYNGLKEQIERLDWNE